MKMIKDVLIYGIVFFLVEICLEFFLRYFELFELWKENIFLFEDICEVFICKKFKMGSCDDDFVVMYFVDV